MSMSYYESGYSRPRRGGRRGGDYCNDRWHYQQERYDTRYRARRERYRERSRSNPPGERWGNRYNGRRVRSRSRLHVSGEFRPYREYQDYPGQVSASLIRHVRCTRTYSYIVCTYTTTYVCTRMIFGNWANLYGNCIIILCKKPVKSYEYH